MQNLVTERTYLFYTACCSRYFIFAWNTAIYKKKKIFYSWLNLKIFEELKLELSGKQRLWGVITRINIWIRRLAERKKMERGQRVYFKRLWLKMLSFWARFPALGQGIVNSLQLIAAETESNHSINNQGERKTPGTAERRPSQGRTKPTSDVFKEISWAWRAER